MNSSEKKEETQIVRKRRKRKGNGIVAQKSQKNVKVFLWLEDMREECAKWKDFRCNFSVSVLSTLLLHVITLWNRNFLKLPFIISRFMIFKVKSQEKWRNYKRKADNASSWYEKTELIWSSSEMLNQYFFLCSSLTCLLPDRFM